MVSDILSDFIALEDYVYQTVRYSMVYGNLPVLPLGNNMWKWYFDGLICFIDGRIILYMTPKYLAVDIDFNVFSTVNV